MPWLSVLLSSVSPPTLKENLDKCYDLEADYGCGLV
jgi:hypothetical protein